MVKFFSHMPIFRRLFLAFLLAVIIPDLLLLAMSIFYTNSLAAHGIHSDSNVLIILALIVSTGVVTVLGYMLNSTITQPLHHLASLARRIREGETGIRAVVTGHDEIAVVASSINSMLDRIEQFIAETQGQKDYLQGQVQHLINEVSGVGKGDLTIYANVSHSSLSALAESFNYMVEALSSLVIRVKTVAMEVEQATTTTQQDMSTLVAATDTQLQQIGQIVTTSEAMVQACMHVAGRTQGLDTTAKEARKAALLGRQSVQQTLEGIEGIQRTASQTASQMQMLGERSKEIDEVVSILENITHQINRLSLDAAIQVAMAGQVNTTGFGAVADGIRRLAEQTKEQLSTVSRNIRSVRTEILTISASIQEAERETIVGAERIQTTGQSLSIIFNSIEQQANDIGAISQMTAHLLASFQDISSTMNTISNTTIHTSKSTRNVAQKTRLVTHVAKQLRNSVEVFRVREAFSTQRPQSHHPEHNALI